MIAQGTARLVERASPAEVEFNITDLHCWLCAATLEEAIRGCDGVLTATVHPISGHMRVRFDDGVLGADDVKEAVRGAGSTVVPIER